MLKLPKVEKGPRRIMSRLEKTQKVIAGVALALGLAVAGLPADEVQAAPAVAAAQGPTAGVAGALLLAPGGEMFEQVARHYSHSSHESHSSHSSHSSHQSHYSSRY